MYTYLLIRTKSNVQAQNKATFMSHDERGKIHCCCGKYKAEKWFLKQDLKNGCVTIIQSEFITHKVG